MATIIASALTTITSGIPTTTGYTPGPVGCRAGSFHSALDYSGMDGTVCAVSISPADFDITQCCSGKVRVVDHCTQYCETASQGNLVMDSDQFSYCVQKGNDGYFVGSMCGEYESGKEINSDYVPDGSNHDDDDTATMTAGTTATVSSVVPVATSVHMGGLAQCEGTSLSRLNVTGLHGTVCRISLSNIDITSCCHGTVRKADDCTQYCEVAGQQGNVEADQGHFADCVNAKNDGVDVANECLVYSGIRNSTAAVNSTATAFSGATSTGSTASQSTACFSNSFPNYDTSSLNGTVCAVSIRPSQLDISSCCSGKVHVVDDCTQFCETAEQDDFFADRSQFTGCVKDKNDGQNLESMCEVVNNASDDGDDSQSDPSTGAGMY